MAVKTPHLSMTICPRHRAELGIRWRCSKERCCVPLEIAAHKTILIEGTRRVESAYPSWNPYVFHIVLLVDGGE